MDFARIVRFRLRSLARTTPCTTVVTIIHVIACLFLILVVLLQTGKGADMGAVFGGCSSTLFGSGGAGNFLTRLTTGMAIVFMLTSLSLTYPRRVGTPRHGLRLRACRFRPGRRTSAGAPPGAPARRRRPPAPRRPSPHRSRRPTQRRPEPPRPRSPRRHRPNPPTN